MKLFKFPQNSLRKFGVNGAFSAWILTRSIDSLRARNRRENMLDSDAAPAASHRHLSTQHRPPACQTAVAARPPALVEEPRPELNSLNSLSPHSPTAPPLRVHLCGAPWGVRRRGVRGRRSQSFSRAPDGGAHSYMHSFFNLSQLCGQ